MPALTYAEITELIKYEIVGNTSTDPPAGAAELLVAVNEAYKSVWEISGGGIRMVGSPTAWQTAQLGAGLAFGLLSNIKQLLQVYVSSTAPSALTTVTATNATLTSSALFAAIKPGMHITGTGISANTFVLSVESASSLTMSQAATDATSTSRTFSDTGEVSGTKKMDPRDFDYIQERKKSDLPGTYTEPKLYSVIRLEPGSPAAAGVTDVNRLRLDYWPPTTGYYFPITFIPEFTPMDGGADVPAVNDVECYDIAYMAALSLVPREGRTDLAMGIALKIGETGRIALERKAKALSSADQEEG